MYIIIPMSGSGQRFKNDGYRKLKPLIRIGGKPIIQHVVEMFPTDCNFVFICRDIHLATTEMRSVLKKVAPSGEILSIPTHKKGPGHAIDLVRTHLEHIKDEVIVNYCDFSSEFDFQEFIQNKHKSMSDGIIFTYTGFHPHMLNDGNYAFVRKEGEIVTDIKEKESYTENKMSEEASSGTYYFSSLKLLYEALDWTLENDINKNGEYYISLFYKYLIKKQKKVSTFLINHMLQWGTPKDLQEYMQWHNYFARDIFDPKIVSVDQLILSMAGAGSRFKNNGYRVSKPFLNVNNKPMWDSARDCMPSANKTTLITQKNHMVSPKVCDNIFELDGITNGQATSVYKYVKDVLDYDSIFVSSVDQLYEVNPDVLEHHIRRDDSDIIVLTAKNHSTALDTPKMFGWIRSDNDNLIKEVSVKEVIDKDYIKDSIIIGAFYFRNAKIFKKLYEEQLSRNITVNGEFYIDSLLQIGLEHKMIIREVQVNRYLSLGTPSNYETYLYWEQYFSLKSKKC